MQTFTIGDATVTRIEESYEPNFDAAVFFPDWRPAVVDEHRSWMVPDHYEPSTNLLRLSVHSWLLRLGGRTILIDACVGNGKARPARPRWHMLKTPYLERLAAAGVSPAEVDVVLCTHLHMDHVGWNTRQEDGRWVPTFPRARYLWSRLDFEHCQRLDGDPATGPVYHGSFRDSVLPVVEAGLAEMVSGDHEVAAGLRIEPAPGHTPGTVALTLASRGQQALFCGDILHHAVQVFQPEWNSFACGDAARARASRRRVLERCAGTGALLMPAHFGAPFVCRVEARGQGFVPRF